jgi:hypothetical protein
MLQVASTLPNWIEQIKWLVSMGGGFWAVFKVYTYVKDALTNTQEGVAGIKTELTAQTQAIVKATDTQTSELRELRTDVGRLVQAMMVPAPSARAARAARRKK